MKRKKVIFLAKYSPNHQKGTKVSQVCNLYIVKIVFLISISMALLVKNNYLEILMLVQMEVTRKTIA